MKGGDSQRTKAGVGASTNSFQSVIVQLRAMDIEVPDHQLQADSVEKQATGTLPWLGLGRSRQLRIVWAMEYLFWRPVVSNLVSNTVPK